MPKLKRLAKMVYRGDGLTIQPGAVTPEISNEKAYQLLTDFPKDWKPIDQEAHKQAKAAKAHNDKMLKAAKARNKALKNDE